MQHHVSLYRGALFLRRTTHQLLLNTPSMPSCSHSPFPCCLSIKSFIARSIGSLAGYFASSSAMITCQQSATRHHRCAQSLTQAVCTT